MELETAITLTDSLIFHSTAQHLNTMQIAILRGVWTNQSYEELANTCHCSLAYVKMVGSGLWALLSEILGEKVSKRTVRAILESYHQQKAATQYLEAKEKPRNNEIETAVAEKSPTLPENWFCSDLLLQVTERLNQSLKAIATKADNLEPEIKTQLHELDSLSQKLRLLHKLSTKNYLFAPTLCDLIQISRQVINDIKRNLPHRTIILSFCEEPVLAHHDLGLLACVDEQLLQYILKNILENALEYSSPNSVVTLDLTVENLQGIFTIKDQGMGIPAKELDLIFQPFHCIPNHRQLSKDGLGLFIVKRCVELHQGQISLFTEAETGSVFTVTLPIYYSEAMLPIETEKREFVLAS